MTQKPHFFKLGLFVLLAFGLTAAMLIAFGAGKFFKTEFLAETCFDESVQGLDVGSEVKYKGVQIGTVKAITTPTKVYGQPSSYVLVIISLTEDCYVGKTGETAGDRFKKAIDDGLSVALSFKGITGAAYLETDYQGTRDTPLDIQWTPRHLYVPSRRSNIKRVGDALNQLLDTASSLNFKGMGQDMGSLLTTLNDKAAGLDTAGLSAEAKGLIKEMRTTTDAIRQFLGSERMIRMVTDAGESFSGLKTMVKKAGPSVDSALQNLESASGSISRVAGDIEADHAEKLARLLASLERTAKMLENMVWLNSDTVRRAVKNLENTSDNLNQLTLELKKYPGRLLLERPPAPMTSERIKETRKQDD
jgi:ABC-type transporter Mla subunit MlaD